MTAAQPDEPIGPLAATLAHPFLVLAPLVALIAAAAAIGLARTPHYTADARINVGRIDVPSYELANEVIGNGDLAASYARSIVAASVLNGAARSAGVSSDYAGSHLTATNIPGSTLIEVQAVTADRSSAVALANGGAQSLTGYINSLDGGSTTTAGLLARYQATQVQIQDINARLRSILGGHGYATPSLTRAALRQDDVDLATAQLQARALGDLYGASLTGQPPAGLVQVAAPATGASSDRTHKLEILLVIGAAAGLVLGLALALARANLARMRTTPAPRTDPHAA